MSTKKSNKNNTVPSTPITESKIPKSSGNKSSNKGSKTDGSNDGTGEGRGRIGSR